MNTGIPISELPEEQRKEIMTLLDKDPNDLPGCSLCGCKGWHACTGEPIIWTEADKLRLSQALDKFYGKQKE